MKRATALIVVALLSIWSLGPARALAADTFAAQLNGFEETPRTLATPGTGLFNALVASDGSVIAYQIFYLDLTSSVLFAHIHFGKPGESGGVATFLCGGGGKDPCPAPGVVFSGTITAADVQAIADQNLAAGDLQTLIGAMVNGFTYANVHTSTFPGGEIRGQIKGAGR
jgi:hypothetical protein